MAAWGKTGRVTLDDGVVLVDDEYAGAAFLSLEAATAGEWYAGEAWVGSHSYHSTLDAAVLWVLKRVDVTLWMEERGPVPIVFRNRSILLDDGKRAWGRTIAHSWASFHDSWDEAIAKAVAA